MIDANKTGNIDDITTATENPLGNPEIFIIKIPN
jgi:hypothetical protein